MSPDARRALLHCAGEHVFVVVAGQDDDRGVRVALLDPPRRLEPVHPGHRDVHQDDVGLILGGRGHGIGPVRRDVDHTEILLPIQGDLQCLAERTLVVDDEDRDGFAGSPVGLPVPGPGSVPVTGHGPRDRKAPVVPSHGSTRDRSRATLPHGRYVRSVSMPCESAGRETAVRPTNVSAERLGALWR